MGMDVSGSPALVGSVVADRYRIEGLLGEGAMGSVYRAEHVHMQKAVALNPESVYHRLDLAEIYVDVDRYSDARQQLTEIAELPVFDAADPEYQAEAAALLKRIANKKDKD